MYRNSRSFRPDRWMLQWSHDLSVVECFPPGTFSKVSKRFNGATTSRSWNAYPSVTTVLSVIALQWSHDLSVVECVG